MRRLVAPIGLAALLLLAPAAVAAPTTSTTSAATVTASAPATTLPAEGSSPLSPGLPESSAPATTETATTPAATTSTTSTGTGGLGKTGTIALIVIAVLLLGGIPYFIWSDSRRKARRIHHARKTSALGDRTKVGSKAPPKSRKLKPAERKRRKRGKAPKRR